MGLKLERIAAAGGVCDLSEHAHRELGRRRRTIGAGKLDLRQIAAEGDSRRDQGVGHIVVKEAPMIAAKRERIG